MRIVLATLFMLIFSFQILPVKEIGKLLFKRVMIEEIHETACDEDEAGKTGSEFKKEGDPYASYNRVAAHFYWSLLSSNGLGISSPEHVSKQFIPDILTPPPNYILIT